MSLTPIEKQSTGAPYLTIRSAAAAKRPERGARLRLPQKSRIAPLRAKELSDDKRTVTGGALNRGQEM
jgi:hypothetical protein